MRLLALCATYERVVKSGRIHGIRKWRSAGHFVAPIRNLLDDRAEELAQRQAALALTEARELAEEYKRKLLNVSVKTMARPHGLVVNSGDLR
jgi:hypothetical protein